MLFKAIFTFFVFILSPLTLKAMQAEEQDWVTVRVWPKYVSLATKNQYISFWPGVVEPLCEKILPHSDPDIGYAPYVLMLNEAGLVGQIPHKCFSIPLNTKAIEAKLEDWFERLGKRQFNDVTVLANIQWYRKGDLPPSRIENGLYGDDGLMVKRLLYSGGIEQLGQTYISKHFAEFLEKDRGTKNITQILSNTMAVKYEQIDQICTCALVLYEKSRRIEALDSLMDTPYQDLAQKLTPYHFRRIYNITCYSKGDYEKRLSIYLDRITKCYMNDLKYFGEMLKANTIPSLSVQDMQTLSPLPQEEKYDSELELWEENLYSRTLLLEELENEMDTSFPGFTPHLKEHHLQTIYDMRVKEKKLVTEIHDYLSNLQATYKTDQSIVGYFNPLAWARSYTKEWQ